MRLGSDPPRHRRPSAALVIRAIGPLGWVVAERPLDTASPITVEDAVEALRSSVRSETGWVPRIVILDRHGRDVSTRYRVD